MLAGKTVEQLAKGYKLEIQQNATLENQSHVTPINSPRNLGQRRTVSTDDAPKTYLYTYLICATELALSCIYLVTPFWNPGRCQASIEVFYLCSRFDMSGSSISLNCLTSSYMVHDV